MNSAGDAPDGGDRLHVTGVRDQHLDRSHLGLGAGGELEDRLVIGQVQRQRQRLATAITDRIGELLTAVDSTCAQDHGVARGRAVPTRWPRRFPTMPRSRSWRDGRGGARSGASGVSLGNGVPGPDRDGGGHYAKDAKAIVDGRVGPEPPLRWEAGDEVSWPHPEMGKFAIAAGIVLFGDRAFGWRLPAVIAGLVTLACVYPLARRLGLPPPWALIALGFAAADTLGIAQSRIATLDVFVGVWTVLCILLALRYAQDGRRKRWLVLCAVAGGMAVATKWSGGLALIAAAVLILLVWLRDREPLAEDAPAETAYLLGDVPTVRPTLLRALPGALLVIALFLFVPAALYFLSYVQYFTSGHTLADWWELQRQALFFSLHLKATHTYASAAPTWIVDYRPVWYYFEGVDTYRGVIAMGNPFLWWVATLGLIAAPILAILRRTTLLLPVAIVVAVLYLPWFATTRTSFLYYMTPVAPFLAILAAAALVAFAGSARLPRRGALVMAATALATAVLWGPGGRLRSLVLLGAAATRKPGRRLGRCGRGYLPGVVPGRRRRLPAGAAFAPGGRHGHRRRDRGHRRGVPADRAQHPHQLRALVSHHVASQLDLTRR